MTDMIVPGQPTVGGQLAGPGDPPAVRLPLAGLARSLARRAGTATRLALLFALILAVAIGGSVAALLHTTTAGLESVAVSQLNAELDAFQAAVDARPAGSDLKTTATAYLRSHAVPDGDLVEVGVPGKWDVANAGGSALSNQAGIEALADQVPARTTVKSTRIAGRTVEVMVAPIRESPAPPGVFLATFDLTGLSPARAAALRLALAEGALALAAGAAGAYLILRRLLRRIGNITETAERIGRGRLVDRLGDQGTADEVGQLARSFDSMLDRIQDAVTAQEQLLSDMSHQLRTPLTVARGHLEVLQRSGETDPEAVRDTIQVAITEMNEMAMLVDRVLALGRAREPRRRDLDDIDLRAFLADFSSSCQVIADRDWVLAPVPDVVVSFDESEVKGALLNLVDNSIRATVPADTIAVSASVEYPFLRISVDDSGPGIPAADRERVLHRYWRPGTGSGTGLGLAIAEAVCRAHEGRIEIGDSPFGGARVTLVLRAAEQPRYEP